MPEIQSLSTELHIKIGGQKIDNQLRALVAEVVVDQHVHLPHMFTIRLYDPGLALLDGGPFDLTKEVEIGAGDAENQVTTLIKGEITALEPSFDEGMVAELLVRGYDKSHRLYRETKSRAFLNKKDSELAKELAKEGDLEVDAEDSIAVYDHVYQHNQSNLAFLMQRAWRIGYECYVEDGKLYFRSPAPNGSAVALNWGEDLLSFRPRMTLAEQVDEVIVKGWDVEKQQPIVGQAQEGNLYPEVEESKNGAEWAGAFGTGKLVIVDQPVISQAEADKLATARLDERSGAFIEAEGTAFRRPDIRAGKMVELKLLGQRFSGKYLVTSATHIYNSEGFSTHFTVRGARTGLLAEQARRQRPLTRWPGVVTAVVTNTDDPQTWGRVKVKFPWMTEDAESDWARLCAPGAGPEAGFHALPAVDDEVLVAFEHGDFSRPFVLGGMWNGQYQVPPTVAGAGQNERPLVRTWHSRTGHAITMYDDSKNKVEIITAGGHTVSIDDASSKIEIKSQAGLTINIDDSGNKISINGSNEVEIKANTNMKLEAGANIDIKANGNLKLDGANVEVNGSAQVAVKGGMVRLN